MAISLSHMENWLLFWRCQILETTTPTVLRVGCRFQWLRELDLDTVFMNCTKLVSIGRCGLRFQ